MPAKGISRKNLDREVRRSQTRIDMLEHALEHAMRCNPGHCEYCLFLKNNSCQKTDMVRAMLLADNRSAGGGAE